MKEQFKVFKNRGLQVVCDRNRVVPDDPGADTPAMVYYKNQKLEASSTFWCAMGEGCLEITKPYKDRYGCFELTDSQVQWLFDIEPEVNEFLYRD